MQMIEKHYFFRDMLVRPPALHLYDAAADAQTVKG